MSELEEFCRIPSGNFRVVRANRAVRQLVSHYSYLYIRLLKLPYSIKCSIACRIRHFCFPLRRELDKRVTRRSIVASTGEISRSKVAEEQSERSRSIPSRGRRFSRSVNRSAIYSRRSLRRAVSQER